MPPPPPHGPAPSGRANEWRYDAYAGLHGLVLGGAPLLQVGPPSSRGGVPIVQLGGLPPQLQGQARNELLRPGHPSFVGLLAAMCTPRHEGQQGAVLEVQVRTQAEVDGLLGGEQMGGLVDVASQVGRWVTEGVTVELKTTEGDMEVSRTYVLPVRYGPMHRPPGCVTLRVSKLGPQWARQGLTAMLLQCAGYAGSDFTVEAEWAAPSAENPMVGRADRICAFVRHPPGDPHLRKLPSWLQLGGPTATLLVDAGQGGHVGRPPPPPPPSPPGPRDAGMAGQRAGAAVARVDAAAQPTIPLAPDGGPGLHPQAGASTSPSPAPSAEVGAPVAGPHPLGETAAAPPPDLGPGGAAPDPPHAHPLGVAGGTLEPLPPMPVGSDVTGVYANGTPYQQWYRGGAGVGGRWLYLVMGSADGLQLGEVRQALPAFFESFVRKYYPLCGDQVLTLFEAPAPIVQWWAARFPPILQALHGDRDPFFAWERTERGGAWVAALSQHLEDSLEGEEVLRAAIRKFFEEWGASNGVARDAPPTEASLPAWAVEWCRAQGYTASGYDVSSSEGEPTRVASGARRSGRARRLAPRPTDLPPLLSQGPGGSAGPRRDHVGRRGRRR